MSRRAAVATQADIHRAIRAMKQAGEQPVVEFEAGKVRVIAAKKDSGEKDAPEPKAVEPEPEIVL